MLTKHVVTLSWIDDEQQPHIAMIVVMGTDEHAVQVDVLKNWPRGRVIGTIAYTAEKFAELALQFRDDTHPMPPWQRTSLN